MFYKSDMNHKLIEIDNQPSRETLIKMPRITV